MKFLHILDNLKREGCKVEGAVFLTYSIDCRTIFAALLKMFTEEPEKESGEKKKNNRKMLVDRFRGLLENGMGNGKDGGEAYSELMEHVAFICNDGNDKSIASPVYWYTKGLTYYYKTEYSFHPKLYILKYTKEEEGTTDIYFRFMVGSMNFVDSHNLDVMMVKDVQAFCEETEGRVNCTILNALLDYEPTAGEAEENLPNIARDRREELKKVLDHLDLHGLWFPKDEQPDFLVFPGGGQRTAFPGKITKVVSPFLSYGNGYAPEDDRVIYTMESELNKNGWAAVEEDGKDCKTYYVYQAKEGEPVFNHTKLYVVNEDNGTESVYIGSANFSESAFVNNKEILVELEFPDDNAKREFLGEIFQAKTDESKCGFVPKRFAKAKEEREADKAQELENLFKKLSCLLSMQLRQEIKKENQRFQARIQLMCGQKELNEKCEMTVRKIYGLLVQDGAINVVLKPFLQKNKSLEAFLLKEDGSVEWTEKGIGYEVKDQDRKNIDDKFLFSYQYQNRKKVIEKEFVYSVESLGSGEKKEDHQYMFLYLTEFLSSPKCRDSMLTKELDRVLQSNPVNISGYFRKNAIPELETILENTLNDPGYKPNGKRLFDISKLVTEADVLTEQELRNLGISPSEKEMIKGLSKQWELLSGELLQEEAKKDS